MMSDASPKQSPQSVPSGPVGFLQEVVQEWKKITWPTPVQVVGQTLVVLLVLVVMTLFIWGLDLGIFNLLELLNNSR
jgi:preprotein translocase SecE subunit